MLEVMIEATVRMEDNKVLIDVGNSTTYQVDVVTGGGDIDKILNENKQAYASFESIAGSQITFRCLLNAGDVDVDCMVSRVVEAKVDLDGFHILIDPSKTGKDFIKVSEVS